MKYKRKPNLKLKTLPGTTNQPSPPLLLLLLSVVVDVVGGVAGPVLVDGSLPLPDVVELGVGVLGVDSVGDAPLVGLKVVDVDWLRQALKKNAISAS